MKIEFRSGVITSVIATVLVGIGTSSAQAQTFAQGTQQDNANHFQLTNAAGGSTFVTVKSGSTAAQPFTVDFKYIVPNNYWSPAGLSRYNSVFDANLLVSASGAHAATGNGANLTEEFDNATITYTAATPVGGKSNLLTVTATHITLQGANGSGAASVLGSTIGVSKVNFTSDFLDFTNTNDQDFGIALSFVTPHLTLASNGYIDSFTAAGVQTYAYEKSLTPSVSTPEATDLAFAVVFGSGMVGLVVRARRTRAAK